MEPSQNLGTKSQNRTLCCPQSPELPGFVPAPVSRDPAKHWTSVTTQESEKTNSFECISNASIQLISALIEK